MINFDDLVEKLKNGATVNVYDLEYMYVFFKQNNFLRMIKYDKHLIRRYGDAIPFDTCLTNLNARLEFDKILDNARGYEVLW